MKVTINIEKKVNTHRLGYTECSKPVWVHSVDDIIYKEPKPAIVGLDVIIVLYGNGTRTFNINNCDIWVTDFKPGESFTVEV